MSSHEGSGNATPITQIQQLIEHHAAGEKPVARWRVGTEHEKFAYATKDWTPLPYEPQGGKASIRLLLEAAGEQGWKESIDDGALIALTSEEGSLALEPGGQFELSGAPRSTIHETRDELVRHVAMLKGFEERFQIRWLWAGMQPIHSRAEISFMPKRRYGVMREYLPTRGDMALDMMQRTSTVQANFDFASEDDMARKLRVALGLGSAVAAMFANSPYLEGQPSGFKSYRAHVWSATDPDRQGLLRFALDGAATYEQYVQWALDVPMFFIVREGRYLKAKGQTFRDFWQNGYHGDKSIRATMEDWELHTSTLFPDARIKTYLETRTADCVPPKYLLALPAFWKGILYHQPALEAAWDLVKRWSWSERWEHRGAAAREGLQAALPQSKAKTQDLVAELWAIAVESLKAQAKVNNHADESVYVTALRELNARGLSPADELAQLYHPKLSKAQLLERLVELHDQQLAV